MTPKDIKYDTKDCLVSYKRHFMSKAYLLTVTRRLLESVNT